MPFNSAFNWFIRRRMAQIDLVRNHPVESQRSVFSSLMHQGTGTAFGVDHGFSSIRNLREFRAQVPIRDYDGLKSYIERAREGEANVLWPGVTSWYAKSSGTTSDRSKYLPVTEDSLQSSHFNGGKDLLALFCDARPDARLYEGKHLGLGGSRSAEQTASGAFTGDLSAIIINRMPFWAKARRTPGLDIALMPDWEVKVDAMARTTSKEDVRILAGVPSWMLVVGKRVLEMTGARTLGEVWPNLQLFMHGGVNFDPYRQQFVDLIGDVRMGMEFMETYNASEGFFGLQDRVGAEDMLLMMDYGIYFEFLPPSEWDSAYPQTLELRELELGKEYALVISTNAGLWRYNLGDVIRVTELRPFRFQVVGRTQASLNAFGEEVMVRQVEAALLRACVETGAVVKEFTVAPVFMVPGAPGGHEWLVEFEAAPNDAERFMEVIDTTLRSLNSDYDAKRTGGIAMAAPRLTALVSGTVESWLRSKGRMGGQFKVPRCASHRRWAEELQRTGIEVA
jgi:hypothetical protein